MDTHNLVSMANRIGQFFESYPDRSEALDGIAMHVQKYWDRRMRQLILAELDTQTDIGLLPIVAEALHTHRALITPKAADNVSLA